LPHSREERQDAAATSASSLTAPPLPQQVAKFQNNLFGFLK
jgi:hypothetical protein